MEEFQEKTWKSVIEILRLKAKGSEISWLSSLKFMGVKNSNFVLGVENDFLKKKIIQHFRSDIEDILSRILMIESISSIEVVVDYSINKDNVPEIEIESHVHEQPSNENKKDYKDYEKSYVKSKPYDELEVGINSSHIFSNFIVGKSNEFAHAASQGVANSIGNVYNPLFIYGGVGLGKTHLMHAIGNRVLEKNRNKKIHYCSSEQFTNDMINSIKNDRMSKFREKYRKLDLLLIDDIQFIAGKESTQEEFFYTFNTLHHHGKQIVISSDRPPQEINNIEERLLSRFAWGLIADIKPPGYETRAAILKKKAEIAGVLIPEDVVNYIAESVSSNIRELEGAFNRIVARSLLMKRKIDYNLVEELFKGYISSKSKRITKDKIISCSSKFYDIPINDIKSNRRKKEISKARQVAMFLMRDVLELPFSEIGAFFGGRDHTTVIHSVNKVIEDKKNSSDMLEDIESIRETMFE